ncbi:MAG: hypothetical protein AAGA46_00375 [Cyanobacteria bacterium P01_F01_bin.13]
MSDLPSMVFGPDSLPMEDEILAVDFDWANEFIKDAKDLSVVPTQGDDESVPAEGFWWVLDIGTEGEIKGKPVPTPELAVKDYIATSAAWIRQLSD